MAPWGHNIEGGWDWGKWKWYHRTQYRRRERVNGNTGNILNAGTERVKGNGTTGHNTEVLMGGGVAKQGYNTGGRDGVKEDGSTLNNTKVGREGVKGNGTT